MARVRAAHFRLDLGDIHRVGDWIDVDHDGRGTDVTDGPSGCDKGHRHGNDFIARSDSRGDQGQMECGGSAVDAHAVTGTDVCGEGPLELRNARSQHIGRTIGNFEECLGHLFANPGVLGLQIQEGDGWRGLANS